MRAAGNREVWGKGKKTQLQENMIGNKQSWGIQKIDFLF